MGRRGVGREMRGEQIALWAGLKLRVFELSQATPCGLNDRAGDACQARDLDAVALRGGAVFDGVQKHQVIAVFDRVEVHIRGLAKFLRPRC